MSAEEAKAGEIALSDGEIAALSWIKAKASSHNGACVEIAAARGNIAIRDSKDPAGPVLLYAPAGFAAFLDGAKNGDFDALLRLSSRHRCHNHRACLPLLAQLRPVVDVPAMINTEYFDDVGFFVNAVDDAVGSAARAVTAGQRAKEWLADPARPKGQGSFTELKDRSRYGFREPLSDSPTRGGLEFDLVALRGHVPR